MSRHTVPDSLSTRQLSKPRDEHCRAHHASSLPNLTPEYHFALYRDRPSVVSDPPRRAPLHAPFLPNRDHTTPSLSSRQELRALQSSSLQSMQNMPALPSKQGSLFPPPPACLSHVFLVFFFFIPGSRRGVCRGQRLQPS
jgi:hypothetical protein